MSTGLRFPRRLNNYNRRFSPTQIGAPTMLTALRLRGNHVPHPHAFRFQVSRVVLADAY